MFGFNRVFAAIIAAIASICLWQAHEGTAELALLGSSPVAGVSAFSFGKEAVKSNVDKAKEQAETAYANAYGWVQHTEKMTSESMAKWSDAQKQHQAEQKAKAKTALEQAEKKMDKYGGVQDAKQKYYESVAGLKASFGHTKKSAEHAYQDAKTSVEIAKLQAGKKGSDELYTAQRRLELAKENLETKFGKGAPSEAEKKFQAHLNELKAKTSTKKSASTFYTQAQDKVAVLQEKVKETQEDWSAWGQAKQAAAKQDLDNALQELNVAKEGLAKHGALVQKKAEKAYKTEQDKAARSLGSHEKAEEAYQQGMEKVREAQAKLEAAQHSWKAKLGSLGKKDTDAAEAQLEESESKVVQAKAALSQHGAKAVSEAQAKFGQLADNVKAQYGASKASAEEAYDRAQAQVRVAQDRMKETGDGISTYFSGKSADAKAQLTRAQANMEEAKENMEAYGEDCVKEAELKYDDRVEHIKTSLGPTKEAVVESYLKAASDVEAAHANVGAGFREKKEDAEHRFALAHEKVAEFGADVTKSAHDKHAAHVAAVKAKFGKTQHEAEEAYKKVAAQVHVEQDKMAKGKAANKQQWEEALEELSLARQNVKNFGENVYQHASLSFNALNSKAKADYAAKTGAVHAVVEQKVSAMQKKCEDAYDKALSDVEAIKEKLKGGQGGQDEKELEAAEKKQEESKSKLQQYGDSVVEKIRQKHEQTKASMESSVHALKDKYQSYFGHDGKLDVHTNEAAQSIADYYNQKVESAKKAYDDARENLAQRKDEKAKAKEAKAAERKKYFEERQHAAQEKLNELNGGIQGQFEKQKEQLAQLNGQAQEVLGKMKMWVDEHVGRAAA